MCIALPICTLHCVQQTAMRVDVSSRVPTIQWSQDFLQWLARSVWCRKGKFDKCESKTGVTALILTRSNAVQRQVEYSRDNKQVAAQCVCRIDI